MEKSLVEQTKGRGWVWTPCQQHRHRVKGTAPASSPEGLWGTDPAALRMKQADTSSVLTLQGVPM